jgi:tetratricopeptide (TPR) repeat protein
MMMQPKRTDGTTLDGATEAAGAGNRLSRRKAWLLALTLLAATFVAYQPVWHAGFIWDDDDYVTKNQALHSADGLQRIWSRPGTTVQYYPLVFTSFWVEYHLWGLQPLGYHLVNVILHAVNAVLLWCVLRRLGLPGAWWAAGIFALHPVNVESVAWVTERKNTLSGVFYLLTALAWLRFRPLAAGETARAPEWRFYWVALGLFACALLSKTVTCSLPAVLVLLIWWKTGRLEKRDGLALAPWFVLGIASGFMTRWMERRLGAIGVDWELSFVQRCLVAGRALWFYAGKLFWPRQLTFIYPRWEIDAAAPWQYAFPLAALTVFIALWFLRSRIGRGPLVAVVFFGGTLAPALGFFNVFPFRYSYVAGHFQYLAGIGLISLAVSTGTAICARAGQWGRGLGTLAAVVVLLVLGMSTWRQARIYQNLETLWRDTLAENPAAWMAHNNLSDVLIQQGKIDEAIWHLEQAQRLKPDDAVQHSNLGLALAQAGRVREAIGQYEQALRIKPDYAAAHSNLGLALARVGKPQEAMEHCEQALRINPDLADAHCNLGVVLAQTGRVPEAIEHFEQALRINPDLAEAHYNLGKAFLQEGRLSNAIGQFEQALRIEPDYAAAHYNLGNALARTGKIEEAIVHLEQALRIKPGDAEVENNLAWLLATHAPAEGGDPVRAVTLAERACAQTGHSVFACLDTLAAAYAAAGRFQEAVSTGQKAIELARAAGQTQAANEIALRLELYRSAHAYREAADGMRLPPTN